MGVKALLLELAFCSPRAVDLRGGFQARKYRMQARNQVTLGRHVLVSVQAALTIQKYARGLRVFREFSKNPVHSSLLKKLSRIF